MSNREYTKVVDESDFEGATPVFSCNDCGAHGEDPREIEHHPTCTPGDSKKWEDFYEAANAEEEAYDNEARRHCEQCVDIQQIGPDACCGCCGR